MLCWPIGSLAKSSAPGEAQTHGLQIMRLTRCLLRYGGWMSERERNGEVILAIQVQFRLIYKELSTRMGSARFSKKGRASAMTAGHAAVTRIRTSVTTATTQGTNHCTITATEAPAVRNANSSGLNFRLANILQQSFAPTLCRKLKRRDQQAALSGRQT